MKKYFDRLWNLIPVRYRKSINRQWYSLESGFVIGLAMFFPLATMEFGIGIGVPLTLSWEGIFGFETFRSLMIAWGYACGLGAFWKPARRAAITIHDSLVLGLSFLFAMVLLSSLGHEFLEDKPGGFWSAVITKDYWLHFANWDVWTPLLFSSIVIASTVALFMMYVPLLTRFYCRARVKNYKFECFLVCSAAATCLAYYS